MKTGILEFCTKYLEKLKNDKEIKELEIDVYKDNRPRISFYLKYRFNIPGSPTMSLGLSGKTLFDLDEEDLKYLYEKYSKRLTGEMNENIDNVKELYNQP